MSQKNAKGMCPRCVKGKLVTDNESGEFHVLFRNHVGFTTKDGICIFIRSEACTNLIQNCLRYKYIFQGSGSDHKI